MSPQTLVNDGNVVLDASPPVTNGVAKDKATQLQSSVLHRSLHQNPHQVIHAEGNYLTLSNGQRILDATGGAAVACLGHNNPRVNAAVTAQMSNFSYCHSLFFSSKAAEDFAKMITDSTHGYMTKLFVVSSGSEAMEASMKLARQYFLELPKPQPNRCNFIARAESYHGITLGALSMSGHVARRSIYEPMLLPNVSRVSACNEYRGKKDGETREAYVERLAEELEAEFQRIGPDTVCAFVAEPVVGAALGCVPAVQGYFEATKAICDRYGALLILDEVMSGMGRTGTLHAWEEEGVVPDIQTVGKGLGGGYIPVAGLLINRRVVDVLDRGSGAFMHGQTYQGHPVACAAGLEVQKIMQEQNLLANVRTTGEMLGRLLKDKLESHEHVGNIRGKGLFWGIEFVQDKASKTSFDPKLGVAMGIHNKGLQEPYNISLYPGTGTADGIVGDHILVSPAFNCSEADIETTAELTMTVIESFFRDFKG